MRLLLDTHALLWWLLDDPRLPPRAREALEATSNTTLFSPINVYEIAFKVRLGKLEPARSLVDDLPGRLAALGLVELPLSAAHAAKAGLLEFDHRDPFDRMLIAQTLVEGMTIVSNETLFDASGVERLWT